MKGDFRGGGIRLRSPLCAPASRAVRAVCRSCGSVPVVPPGCAAARGAFRVVHEAGGELHKAPVTACNHQAWELRARASKGRRLGGGRSHGRPWHSKHELLQRCWLEMGFPPLPVGLCTQNFPRRGNYTALKCSSVTAGSAQPARIAQRLEPPACSQHLGAWESKASCPVRLFLVWLWRRRTFSRKVSPAAFFLSFLLWILTKSHLQMGRRRRQTGRTLGESFPKLIVFGLA